MHLSSVCFLVLVGLATTPQMFTSLGYTVAGCLHHQGISVLLFPNDCLVHYPHQNLLLNHQSNLLQTIELGFQTKFRKVGTGTSPRHSVPWCLTSARSGEGSPPRFEGLYTQPINTSVRLCGVTQLGLRFHTSRLPAPETTPTTFQFLTNQFTSPWMSDQSVLQPLPRRGSASPSSLLESLPTIRGGYDHLYGHF